MKTRYSNQAVRSPADGGWYAEVWETNTGKDVHTTGIYETKRDAEKAAESFCEAREWCDQRRERDAVATKL